eukprot:CAMPEP_0185198550 /NCGR_PEP_ID=MMETSP1140-20130426/43144_1 /TAXON_ID=298111 /ORGANISM="Pavlova sp., Strain CCMP459" /LENGTH=84 /DNA_ID=CAMNT_0027765759 /DNA_START=93 /DNA_END=344 /DNA_ORIENTATION=-
MSTTEEPQQPADAGTGGLKRPRTAWEVDVSLEKLVSWDVLEQFMQEFPDENSLLGGGPAAAATSAAVEAEPPAGPTAPAPPTRT